MAVVGVVKTETVSALDLETQIRLQYGQSRAYEAYWKKPNKHTDHYLYRVEYCEPGGSWRTDRSFDGGVTDPDHKSVTTCFSTESTVAILPTVPDSAQKIRVKVRPVSKKYKVQTGEKTTSSGKKKKKTPVYTWYPYFELNWKDIPWVEYTCGVAVDPGGQPVAPTVPELTAPSAPSIDRSGYKLTVTSGSSDSNVGFLSFEIYRDGAMIGSGRPALAAGVASMSMNVYTNGKYTARVCAVSIDGTRQSEWSDWASSDINLTPSAPAVPSVEVKNGVLTAEINNIASTIDQIQFEIVQDNNQTVLSQAVGVISSHSQIQFTIAAGGLYKVRARGYDSRTTYWSEYSDYSSNVATPPPSPGKFTSYKAVSTTAVELQWEASKGATSYEIEYTKEKKLFDTSSETSTITVSTNTANITGLETGNEWFFRVRAKNDAGASGWCSEIVSVAIGEKPAAPQTWSNRTVIEAGKKAVLYWVHNSKDNSSQTYAEIEINATGKETKTVTIQNSTEELLKDKTSSYELDTSEYTDGTVITWRIRTRGILPDYGDWSVMREIDIYSAPSLTVLYKDGCVVENAGLYKKVQYPLILEVEQSPKSQTAVEYFMEVIADETHESTDYTGETIIVSKGTTVFSKHYYIRNNSVELTLGPQDAILAPDVTYMVRVTVSTDTGLNAEWTDKIRFSFSGDIKIGCEIGIDYVNYSAVLRPAVEVGTGFTAQSAIYRREIDGTFTLIEDNIPENTELFYTDLHPSLDYARYRIVTKRSDGVMDYKDLPNMTIGGDNLVIQWDQKTAPIDLYEDDENESLLHEYVNNPRQTGMMLELPYNIDTSDSISQDVEHVQYIGRKHPTSYHGTQLGETATWNADVPMDDEETYYLLRALRVYMGNVYVREPSGTGYWATVSVSFNRKHDSLVMPVTLAITRVEGGA